MSELCVYLNGHVTGLVQSDEGHSGGYQRVKKNLSANNLKFEIDLNQNFEIPRIRTLKSSRSNSFNCFNEDFQKKKLRIYSESVQNLKDNESFKYSMSKSISELFFPSKNPLSSGSFSGTGKPEKKNKSRSKEVVDGDKGKCPTRTKSLTLDEKNLTGCSRSDSFGSPANYQVPFGRAKVRKRDSKKNVSRKPLAEDELIRRWQDILVSLCLSLCPHLSSTWQTCFLMEVNTCRVVGHSNGIRVDSIVCVAVTPSSGVRFLEINFW
ncbi:hypothetical protein RUM43_002255 [Polyplax serrata]|uniref:Uncharacterized protein n=1 Tax=Polyplax serrata TaxID=468196 RepID=A0AAN8NYZ8_POLSC